MIPSCWNVSSIGQLFEIAHGKSVTPTARSGSNQFPFLRTSNVFWGKILLDDLDRMSFSPEEIERMTLRDGDILVCEGGDIGRSAVWTHGTQECAFQNHLHRLRARSENVDPFFFMYWLQAGFTLSGFYDGVGNRTTIPNLSRSRLAALEVPLPDLSQQIAISSILRSIQQAIEVETNLIRVTRELKAAVMKKLFTEGLNGEPQKETEIGMVPESWKVSELREFVTVKSGGTPSRDKPEYWIKGTIPWVKTGEVDYCVITDTSERITEAGMENSAAKVFPSGTLLMAMYGQGVTRGKVGLLGIPATTNQACAAIFPDDRVTSLFLYHFLEFQYENIRGMGHGANQKNLNSDIIKAIKCPIPSPAEQSAICRYLDTLNSSLFNLERKRVALESLFQSSLQNLMSGSIRVTDLLLDSSVSVEDQGVAA
jgi:type I restriction enzyme S subunit